jgi:organic hydroperoxide reductase OsmC/OhrA
VDIDLARAAALEAAHLCRATPARRTSPSTMSILSPSASRFADTFEGQQEQPEYGFLSSLDKVEIVMSDTFEIRLERLDGYRFLTDFGTEGVAPLIVDEPPPLGEGTGPNPARLLAAAVGDCLSASLLFCLGKSRVEVAGVKTRVAGTYRRNERGRLRITVLDVSIQVDVPGSDQAKLGRCLEMFEDFCVVTASVRKGVDVGVTVTDIRGNQLFASPAPGSS